MHTIRITLAVILIGASLYVSIMNCLVFVNNHIQNKKWASAIPFLGGILGAIGIVLLPHQHSWKFFWIPFLLDWGSLPVLIAAVFRTWENQRKQME